MSPPSLRRQYGMTLVELLVAMAIGLVVTLAVTSIVIIGESNKRTTAATNDTNQTGSFAAFAIDRLVRSAGSGFAQSWNLGVFGCRLSASRQIGGTATTILPRTAAFPAPFAGVLGGAPTNLRVAPVLIANGQSAGGSDVLVVMGGNAATGDIPRAIRTPYPFVVGANSGVRLDNTIGLSNLDLGLISQNGITDCLIEQVTVAGEAAPPTQAPYVASPFLNTAGNQVLPLAGQYFTASGTDTSLSTLALSGASYFTPLGNLTAGNAQFALIGVDANRTLIAYDLLRTTGAGGDAESLQPVAEGVTEMHAIYGMDTNNDGTVDTWIDPGSTGYDIATLMARPPAMTTTAPYTIRQIMAIRVALVLRGSNYEKEVVTLVRPKLFPGTPGEVAQLTLTGDDQHYRYRVIDTTIPLRDMLLLPNS